MYDIHMCPGSKNAIEIVGCHAEGDVRDVIIKGVEAIPGPGTESWL
jgi:proline racemase